MLTNQKQKIQPKQIDWISIKSSPSWARTKDPLINSQML